MISILLSNVCFFMLLKVLNIAEYETLITMRNPGNFFQFEDEGYLKFWTWNETAVNMNEQWNGQLKDCQQYNYVVMFLRIKILLVNSWRHMYAPLSLHLLLLRFFVSHSEYSFVFMTSFVCPSRVVTSIFWKPKQNLDLWRH